MANIVTVIAASSQFAAATVNAEVVDDNILQLSVSDASETPVTISQLPGIFIELVTPIQGVEANLSTDSGVNVGVVGGGTVMAARISSLE